MKRKKKKRKADHENNFIEIELNASAVEPAEQRFNVGADSIENISKRSEERIFHKVKYFLLKSERKIFGALLNSGFSLSSLQQNQNCLEEMSTDERIDAGLMIQ